MSIGALPLIPKFLDTIIARLLTTTLVQHLKLEGVALECRAEGRCYRGKLRVASGSASIF
jgi:hypothetical protein